MKKKHAQHAANVRWDKHRKNMKELETLRNEVLGLREANEAKDVEISSLRHMCRSLNASLALSDEKKNYLNRHYKGLESENAQLKAEQKITVQIGSALLAIVAVGISVLVWQIVKGQPLF